MNLYYSMQNDYLLTQKYLKVITITDVQCFCKIEPMYKSVFGGQSEVCIFTKEHIKSTKIVFFSFFACLYFVALLKLIFYVLFLKFGLCNVIYELKNKKV